MKLPMAEKERLYIFRDDRLTVLDSPLARPLRWAAWQPDGSWCLLVGNGGTAVRYASNGRFEPIATGTKHNLRGAAFSPDGAQALLVGNRGAVLLLDPSTLRRGSGQASLRAGGGSVRALPSPTTENLRRAAWHPDGSFALILGNAGTVLRYQ